MLCPPVTSPCVLPGHTGGVNWRATVESQPLRVKRRVRKGIPDAIRGLAWQVMSGGRSLLLQNEGVYERLVTRSKSPAEMEIVRDIGRTFPSHMFFRQKHGLGQRSLYNVLKAYSVYNRNVGYVQVVHAVSFV
eukprot:scaffold1505_cov390-Prasinococcus_capsulatus_cf.AAC.16